MEGRRLSTELDRAREVRPILDDVDFLLDIHSMQHPTVPLMMCGPTEKGRRLARALTSPSHVVIDAGHTAGTRMRDYGGFVDRRSPKNSLLVECGQHWEPASVEMAKDISLRFLAHFEVVSAEFVAEHMRGAPPPVQRVIEVSAPVTVSTEDFRFVDDYRGMEVIEKAGSVIALDGTREIQTPYDNCVLIMPSRRLRKGESAVRFGRYVE